MLKSFICHGETNYSDKLMYGISMFNMQENEYSYDEVNTLKS